MHRKILGQRGGGIGGRGGGGGRGRGCGTGTVTTTGALSDGGTLVTGKVSPSLKHPQSSSLNV